MSFKMEHTEHTVDGMDQDNQVEKTEKLLAEPTTEGAELDDYHPCEVRASNISQLIGGLGCHPSH